MIGLMILSVVLCTATVAGGLFLLYLLSSVNVRRYNTAVATDVLNAWTTHLAALDPGRRERALSSPPPAVVAAMAMLPSKGLAGFFSG